MSVTTLSSKEAIRKLIESPSEYAWIDVRSEGEFTEGAFPNFKNEPILNDNERKHVGTTYKHCGQEAAIQLGYKLVEPDRLRRVIQWLQWIDSSPQKTGVVTCWRGGLRSKLACQWLHERGARTYQIEGGYKALRNEAAKVLEDLPPLLVLSGLTGSGKTRLLKSLPAIAVDLEHLANHRGSAFGIGVGDVQPTQQYFENPLLLQLISRRKNFALVEDESSSIGTVGVPPALKNKMKESSVVFLEARDEERAKFIFDEYVLTPIQHTQDAIRIRDHLLFCLKKIEKKLGGLKTQELSMLISKAFEREGLAPDSKRYLENHEAWILSLLRDYYDKMYMHAFDRQDRKIIFRGDAKDCSSFIQDTYKRNQ